MTTGTAITILVDFFAAALLIYGFIYEEKLIKFEMNVKRIVLGNIRRAIRIHNRKKAIQRGEHLHEVRRTRQAPNRNANTYVA